MSSNINRKYKALYDEKHYASNDGFSVNIWGKLLWNFLHIISFNYPNEPTEQDKDNYNNFILSLQYVLPCKACRENLKKNLELVGYGRECLENRKAFSMFIYRLHNCVNKMLGKECPITYEEVRDRYEAFRARCVDGVPTILKNTNIEKGCLDPLIGIKSKTVIQVVPLEAKKEAFKVDPRCIPKKKINNKK